MKTELGKAIGEAVRTEQSDKATPRPLIPNCNQNGREIRFGETVVAKVGTASTNGWTDDAIAALVVRAVNEHAALDAMNEAAERALNYLADLNGCNWFANPEHYAVKDMAQRAKALQQILWDTKSTLTAIRKGGSK